MNAWELTRKFLELGADLDRIMEKFADAPIHKRRELEEKIDELEMEIFRIKNQLISVKVY